MNINILSVDVYFSTALYHLIQPLGDADNPKSIVFIDVMNLPALDVNIKKCFNNADCLIFVVNRTADYLLIHDEVFQHIKSTEVVKCICKSSPTHEFEKILTEDVKYRRTTIMDKHLFNTPELKLIKSMKSGMPANLNSIYKDTNQKTLSGWKRSIMKKLEITGDINLYQLVMKCHSLADWFY